jgi:hypothetical protein
MAFRGCAELVRHHRHEVVLDAAGALGLGSGTAFGFEQPSRSARARFCSLMSRAIFDAPMTRPEQSRTGETVSDTSTSRPSLARRTV